MQTMNKDRTLDDVKHRFEWDAKNFDAIYRLERSPVSRWFNKIFRKAASSSVTRSRSTSRET